MFPSGFKHDRKWYHPYQNHSQTRLKSLGIFSSIPYNLVLKFSCSNRQMARRFLDSLSIILYLYNTPTKKKKKKGSTMALVPVFFPFYIWTLVTVCTEKKT
ncbi:unnamed protein product [Citrullus colocynthis]|uniref:Uncharacterized protein n=1 Tax=Citrullus colocynthis TaxID=252529 RepID=A0ABP0Y2G0_9ROSI